MMFRKINTTLRKILYKVPSKWSDVSYQSYCLLNSDKEQKIKYALITGLEVDTVSNPLVYSKIDQDILTLYNQELKPYVPSYVVVRGGKVLITKVKDITLKSIAQYEDAKKSIQEDGEEALPLVVAIYLQPEIGNGYDYNEAEKMAKDIERWGCEEVIGLANFFLSKSKRKRNVIVRCAHLLMRVIRRLWRGLVTMRFIITGASTLIYTTYQVVTC